MYGTNRKQEDIRIIRSDDLQNVQNTTNELVRIGYELIDTKVFGEKFIAILIKYKEPEKETTVMVPTKKPRINKKEAK